MILWLDTMLMKILLSFNVYQLLATSWKLFSSNCKYLLYIQTHPFPSNNSFLSIPFCACSKSNAFRRYLRPQQQSGKLYPRLPGAFLEVQHTSKRFFRPKSIYTPHFPRSRRAQGPSARFRPVYYKLMLNLLCYVNLLLYCYFNCLQYCSIVAGNNFKR